MGREDVAYIDEQLIEIGVEHMNFKKFIIILALAIFAVATICIVIVANPKWISIYDTDYCINLKNETITEITMRQTTDSVVEVVFSDEDLIEQWSSILDTMEIQYNWKNTHYMKRMYGGQPLLTVQTNQGTYRFAFNERSDGYLITIDSKRYLIKNPEAVQFRQIYSTAVDRHGTTSIF